MSKEEYRNEYQKIKVSKEAYFELKKLAKKDKYHGRGLIGAFDDIILGRFTTSGSGKYEKNQRKKSENVPKKP